MNNKIANIKLESFFRSKKLTKQAASEYFKDVITEDDLEAISSMLHAMVMLDKYKRIKDQLKSTNGIVNFVTYDEFEPLVEMIFKMSVPPSSNDIYHMGLGFSLPEDYFVDAKSYFGDQGSTPADSQPALENLDRVIKGTPKKMTREWLKANGLDPDGASFASVFGDTASSIRDALKNYKDTKNDLLNSDLKTEIDSLFRKLDKDRVLRKQVRDIEAFNSGRPEAQRKPIPKILSKDELKKVKAELSLKRGFYARALTNLEFEASGLNIPEDMFSKEVEYNNDGFLGWAPEDEIKQVYIDILDSSGTIAESQMSVKFSNLMMKTSS